MVEEKTLRGVSVDLADVTQDDVEFTDTGVIFHKCNVAALTLLAVPAFADANISVVASADGVVDSSWISFEFDPQYADCECDFATKIPVEPPKEWFEKPKFDRVTPVQVERNGRVFGHVSEWGACHIGYGATCKEVPRGGYKKFLNKNIECSDGSIVPCGPIVIGTDHADRFAAADVAQDHYAHTGFAVADVTVFEDEFGLGITGALRPDVSGAQVRVLRGSDISPDWRKVRTVRDRNGKWEMVGLLAVNTSGFVSDSIRASAGFDDDFVVEEITEAQIGLDDSGLVSFMGGNIVFKSSSVGDGNSGNIFSEPSGSNGDLKEPVVPEKSSVEVEVVPVFGEAFMTAVSTAVASIVEKAFADALVAAAKPVEDTVDTDLSDDSVVVEEDSVAFDGAALVAQIDELQSKVLALETVISEFQAEKKAAEAKAKFGSKFGVK
jgi:hypothetical protein